MGGGGGGIVNYTGTQSFITKFSYKPAQILWVRSQLVVFKFFNQLSNLQKIKFCLSSLGVYANLSSIATHYVLYTKNQQKRVWLSAMNQ